MSRTLPITKNHYTVFLAALAVIALVCVWVLLRRNQPPVVNSFEECAQHYPIMESYPAQCTDGHNSFTQSVSPAPAPVEW
jgi:hypothetical protein